MIGLPVRLTLNKQTALRVIRSLRSAHPGRSLPRATAGVVSPDPSPAKRWSQGLVDLSSFGIPSSGDRVLHVLVPSKGCRLRIKGARNTVISHGLPERCAMRVAGGLYASCPEQLFLDMASEMSPAVHLMLGLELCGRFSRDAADPRNGEVTYKVRPACSKESIRRYLDACHDVIGLPEARATARLVMDNAWSSTEAVIATLMRLPFTEYGYELGDLVLNPRVSIGHGHSATRVPDILLAGTRIGVNFDGEDHLDLDRLIEAAFSLGERPADEAARKELENVRAALRQHYVDDRRRDRELMAEGYLVFSVTKEDLFAEGGLDQLMLQVMDAAERHAGRDYSFQRQMLRSKVIARRRQRLIWGLLPGSYGQELLRRHADANPDPVVEEHVILI